MEKMIFSLNKFKSFAFFAFVMSFSSLATATNYTAPGSMYVNDYFNKGDSVTMPSGYSVTLIGVGYENFNNVGSNIENVSCGGYGVQNLPSADFEVTSPYGIKGSFTLQPGEIVSNSAGTVYLANITNVISEGYSADVTIKDGNGAVLASNANFRSGDSILAGQTTVLFYYLVISSAGEVTIYLQADSGGNYPYFDGIELKLGEEKQVLGVKVKFNSFSRGTGQEPIVGYNISDGFNTGVYEENHTIFREANVTNIGYLKIGESVTTPNGAILKLASIFCTYAKIEPEWFSAALQARSPNGTTARALLRMRLGNPNKGSDFEPSAIDFSLFKLGFSTIFPNFISFTVDDGYPIPTATPTPSPSPTPVSTTPTSTPAPTTAPTATVSPTPIITPSPTPTTAPTATAVPITTFQPTASPTPKTTSQPTPQLTIEITETPTISPAPSSTTAPKATPKSATPKPAENEGGDGIFGFFAGIITAILRLFGLA